MPRSVYSSAGSKSEQLFHEDLIVESLSFYGTNFYYIPRTLVAKDEILGEDRLSKFKHAYAIEMYLENVDGFDGQGAFIQKFGLMMEQSATLVVARRRWEQLIGRFGRTILPGRPCEGDLIYFPLTDALFEIKFVSHQDPFYQIGKLFVYKLQVELFQYASERMETGVKEIDDFETLKSFDTSIIKNGVVTSIVIEKNGSGYSSAPTVLIGEEWQPETFYNVGTELCFGNKRYMVTVEGTTSSITPTHSSGSVANGTAQLLYTGARATATAQIGSGDSAGTVTYVNITNGGNGYTSPPKITFTGTNIDPNSSFAANATAYIDNIDRPDSYGDNNKFKEEAASILFNEDNPFGDFYEVPTVKPSYTMDSTAITMDSTSITMDKE